ncbi:hypothetical protein FIBSPDRAFT_877129 [Athelia psychrophila]|uniref:Uncharacterized protein n=1 Tax=Athelia psychrophila TaxID=1759441 RepID=A0A167W7W4_9AGAM|nr:hypothetical protein FIBSPDRAFT_877129 [Fibularhizoctonia sp. CBS 109695]
MAIEMNRRMQVGSSLLKNESSVVEDGEPDVSFEYHAPTLHGLSKFSRRLATWSSRLG